MRIIGGEWLAMNTLGVQQIMPDAVTWDTGTGIAESGHDDETLAD
jgi:hypothetical protein